VAFSSAASTLAIHRIAAHRQPGAVFNALDHADEGGAKGHLHVRIQHGDGAFADRGLHIGTAQLVFQLGQGNGAHIGAQRQDIGAGIEEGEHGGHGQALVGGDGGGVDVGRHCRCRVYRRAQRGGHGSERGACVPQHAAETCVLDHKYPMLPC
jgi:hypothetical protein